MDAAESYKIYQKWIEDCLSSDKLSEWEDSFVRSIKFQLESKGRLSVKQVEVLERIYADKT